MQASNKLIIVPSMEHIYQETNNQLLTNTRYCTLAQFFDQIKSIAFLDNKDAIFFDRANIHCLASNLIDKNNSLKDLNHYLDLLSTIYNSGYNATQLYSSLQNSALIDQSTFENLKVTWAVETDINNKGYYFKDFILKKTYDYLLHIKTLPDYLANINCLRLQHIYELSFLQIAIFSQLTNLGILLEIENLSPKFSASITDHFNKVVKKIKSKGNIANIRLVDSDFTCLKNSHNIFITNLFNPNKKNINNENIIFFAAQNHGDEGNWIAANIVKINKKKSKNCNIAVVCRNLNNVKIYQDRLNEYGIKTHIKQSSSLLDSCIGKLLIDIINAGIFDIPKSFLKRIILNNNLQLNKKKHFSYLTFKLLDLTYHENLSNVDWQTIASKAKFNFDEKTEQYLNKIIGIIKNFPLSSSIYSYYQKIIDLIKNDFIVTPENHAQILYDCMEKSISWKNNNDDKEISLQDFLVLLTTLLSKTTITEQKTAEDCVTIMPMSEIIGLQFDFVFIADMTFDQLPKIYRQKGLLKDKQKIAINKLLNEQIFTLDEQCWQGEQDFITKPEKEPLLFAMACLAAKKGLYFSHAKYGADGKELVTSAYFSEAIASSGKISVSTDNKMLPKSKNIAFFAEQIDNIDVDLLNNYKEFTKHHEELCLQLKSDDRQVVKKFNIGKKIVDNYYGNFLGLNSAKPMSPSKVEKLASCAFKGFIESVLRLDFENHSVNVDNRWLGQLAHLVMKDFYQLGYGDLSIKENKQKYRDIIHDLTQKYAEKMSDEISSQPAAIIRANVMWLSMVLAKTVITLYKYPPVADVAPKYFEMPVGFGKKANISIEIAEQQMFFGGIIDRIDTGFKKRMVIDYKISSASSIKQKLAKSSLFTSHFQLPLYLRLLEELYPTKPDWEIGAYLISLKDSVATKVLGIDDKIDIRHLIMNDDDGLIPALTKIFKPLFDGDIRPSINKMCKDCKLKLACRVVV